MKVYNKLVRDNIPQIIHNAGKICDVEVLKDKQYKIELRRKLVEEALELSKSNSKQEMIEELADVFELLDYILIEEKIDILEVKKRRIQKNMDKGGFDDKLYLKHVRE